MPADIIFDGENVDGSGIGTIKITCMHDPYDLRCPVCGHSLLSHLTLPGEGQPAQGNAYACEVCGVQVTLFPDAPGCRFLMEVQGA